MTEETKKKILYIAIGVLLTSIGFAGMNYFFPTSNYDIAKSEFSEIQNQLVYSEEKSNNIIEVYQLPNRKVIINTYSKNDADMAEQFSFNPDVEIDKSNINITWNSESDNSVGFNVQLKIEKDGRIYFNREITFIDRALQGVNSLFNKKE